MTVPRKYAVFVGDELWKLPDLHIAYEVRDRRKKTTGPWRLTSRPGEPGSIDLTFEPRYHRRDRHRLPFVFHVDHSQYFGPVSGHIVYRGRKLLLENVFASAEESLMET